MSNDFKKHIQLIESIGMREEDYEDEFNLDPTETPDGDYDMSMDDSGYDVDNELDMEIARSDVEDMGGEEDYSYDEPDMMDMEPNLDADGTESDDPIFNYTATIQIHGYDFPLVLQADDMDEIKTVMQVLKQSGLNPKGDYKWNSKTFEIDLDESAKSVKKKKRMSENENGHLIDNHYEHCGKSWTKEDCDDVVSSKCPKCGDYVEPYQSTEYTDDGTKEHYHESAKSVKKKKKS
jgi:phage FluMu protein Com